MEHNFKVGDRVTYIAYEGATPEHGVVNTVKQNKVWVRYNGPTGQLTPVNKLIKR